MGNPVYEHVHRLYFAQVLTSTRIAKLLGISTSIVKKLFTKLYSMGLFLKPDICTSRMELRPVSVLVSGNAIGVKRKLALQIPYLKSVWISPRRGSIFILYLPMGSKLILDEEPNKDVKIFYYFYKLWSRPSLELIEMLYSALEDVAKRTPSEPLPEIENLLNEKAKFDSLDLDILEALYKMPWASMRELASLLNIRRGYRLEHHVPHAEELISGYGFSRIGILYSEYGSMMFLFYRCRDSSLFVRTVLRHPFTLGATWSRHEVCLQIYYPARYGTLYHFTLSSIAHSFGCEEIESVEIITDPSFSLITSFPSRDIEYSKMLRSWKPLPVKLSQLLSCVEWGR